MDSRYHWVLYAFIGAWGALLVGCVLLVLKPVAWQQMPGTFLLLLLAFTFTARALAEFCASASRPQSNADDLKVDVYVGPHRIATLLRSTLGQWRAESFRSAEAARALGRHGATLAAWAMGACVLILVLLAVAIPEPPTRALAEMAPMVAILGSVTVAALAAYDWPRLLEDRFMEELLKRYPERPAGILALHAHAPGSDAA